MTRKVSFEDAPLDVQWAANTKIWPPGVLPAAGMTGCDFACDAIRVIDENGERWKVRVSNPAYNHGPDLHPSAEPAHRKRDEAAKKLILVLQAAHLTPRDILNILIKHDQEANYTRAEYQE